MEQDDLREEPVEDTDTQTEESEEAGGAEGSMWEKRYKDIQRHTTKIEHENKDLRSRMDQLIGRFEQSQKPDPQPEPDWIDAIDDEAIKDDPAKVKELMRRQEAEFLKLLQLRDKAYDERLSAFDPDVLSVKDRIAELKQDPDYKGFTDKQLSVIAKKVQQEPEAEERRESRGTVGGGKRPVRTEATEDVRKKYAPYLDAMRSSNKSVYGGK